jgi:predicted aminopeptidase
VFEQIERQELAPVVAVETQAEADLLVATLRVQGIEAYVAMPSAFPSLDWVDGFVLSVALEEEALVREVLRQLGHEPLDPPKRPLGP